MRMAGNTLYVGGEFGNIGGAARNRLAAIDLISKTPTAWDPDVDASVMDILPAGNTIYASGAFTTVGIDARKHVAAIDATTGVALPFIADANDYVTCMALDGSVLFCGGNFTTAFTLPRNRAAAFHATTGSLLLWQPAMTAASVETIQLVSGHIYLGGYFSGINNAQGAAYLGAVDGTDASVPSFDPRAGGAVRTMINIGASLYIGGAFGHVTNEPFSNLAAVASAPLTGVGDGPSVRGLEITSYPNPFNPSTTIGYTAPSPGEVKVRIYDARGALVKTLFDGYRAAGVYTVTWDGRTDGAAVAASGVYFARIEHASGTRSRKMVLLK